MRKYKLDIARDMNGNIKTILAEDKATGKVAFKITIERDAHGKARSVSVEGR